MLDTANDDWIDLDLPQEGLGDIAVNTVDLGEALVRWKRGERKEALHWLERALGRDFTGLGDLTPEQLR